MKLKSARGRSAAAVLASMALMGAGAAVTTAPAQSAAPNDDCAEPYPVADLTKGMAVTGLTVVEGTVPIEFTGSYLGKINGGIAPRTDMLMFEMDFADDKYDNIGIWQGMSGSPVYAEDGSLIGAVAYGLAWGPSLVAGVTPFENMDDWFGGSAPATVQVGEKKAKAIAAETDVTAEQAEHGFRQLPMPLAFSGISQARLRQMKKKGPDYLHTRGATTAGAASSAADVGPESLVAGGNLGAAISYGDITAGGVGTVTSVCNGELIGFGHPMTFGGKTSLGLMPADAIYIQEDSLGAGFKVANMGLPAGTIDEDRLTGISGPLGPTPAETLVSSRLRYADNPEQAGESRSLVNLYNADVTFSHLLANHDVVLSAIQPGSEVGAYTITGTDADGQPFDIELTDRYTSRYDIAFEGIWDISDIVWMLSQMRDVTLTSVDAGIDISDETRMQTVSKVEQRRGNTWVQVNRRNAAVVKPGGVLQLRVTLTGGDGPRTVAMTVKVPANAKRRGFLQVAGGQNVWSNAIYRAKTPAALEKAVAGMARNDEVQATLSFFKRGKDIERTVQSEPQDFVVRGSKWATVKVRR